MTKLTERRKADRAKMAAIIESICREFGATVQRENEGENSISPRRISLDITASRGLCVALDFDGESCQPDTFLNPWNMNLETDACLSDRFPGSVNNSHFRKSTTVCHGFESLCDHVRQVLQMANDGIAFDLEREKRRVAEHGTWQEQKAKWDAYRAEWAAQKATENAA